MLLLVCLLEAKGPNASDSSGGVEKACRMMHIACDLKSCSASPRVSHTAAWFLDQAEKGTFVEKAMFFCGMSAPEGALDLRVCPAADAAAGKVMISPGNGVTGSVAKTRDS